MADQGDLKGKGRPGKPRPAGKRPAQKRKPAPAADSRIPSSTPPVRSTPKRSKPTARPEKPATPRAKPAAPSRATPATPAKQPKRASGAVGASAAQQAELERIQREFNNLQAGVSLSSISSAIGDLDSAVRKLPTDLRRLRDRGYMHAGRLEERIQGLSRQWRTTRPRVESTLRSEQARLNTELDQAQHLVQRMSATNAATVSSAAAAVDGLERQLRSARDSVDGLYESMQQELYEIENDMRKVSAVLDLIDSSPEIHLRQAEGPLQAVKAVWRRDGDEGPEGNLILTDQRLLFEQNEEVVTKKRFGIFAAEKEKVQRLLFDVPAYEIEQAKAGEEGGFLGVGKDEILDLVLGASAPVTRATFHLKGQDSEEWCTWINRVKSGEIDSFRHAQFQEEVAEAAALLLTFPSQCPTCFAPVPTPPRGVTSVTCEFCGAIIKPEG